MAATSGLVINGSVRLIDDKGLFRTVLPEIDGGGEKLVLKFENGALNVFSTTGQVLARAQPSLTERDVTLATASPEYAGTRQRLLDLTPSGLEKIVIR